MMMAGRSRAGGAPRVPTKDVGSSKTEIPTVLEFLGKRDYVGACTLLEHKRSFPQADFNNGASDTPGSTTNEWLAYAYFHSGDPQKALEVYRTLLNEDPENADILQVFASACLYYLGRFDEATEEAEKCSKDSNLKTRVLFHCAHKKGDEQLLMRYHQQLSDSLDDQLTLASVHYHRGHYQEAVDIYKRLLLEDGNRNALNVYVSLCYFKLEYYAESLELLEVYLHSVKNDSNAAVNLKACNVFKLGDGEKDDAGEAAMRVLGGDSNDSSDSNDISSHNEVVFRNGEGAKRVLPTLLSNNAIPEALLNLCIWYLKNAEPNEAFLLLRDVEPSTPHEYILRGVTHAVIGQLGLGRMSRKGDSLDPSEHLKLAQQCFQIVGSSASESDTIPGRQAMASCFLLLEQHADALVYLKSIVEFSKGDCGFHWNFGMASAASGDWKTGLDELSKVIDKKYRSELSFKVWMAKCLVRCGRAPEAWTLCEECAEQGGDEGEDGTETGNDQDLLFLLKVVADCCYEVGEFYVAMRAFDELERLEDSDTYWDGKRGAAVGVFVRVITGKESQETLRDVVQMLRHVNTTEADNLLRPMLEWAEGEGIRVE